MKWSSGGTNPVLNKPKIVEMPCQNCGKLVKVIVPFVGCVFCSDCAGGRTVAYMFKEKGEG